MGRLNGSKLRKKLAVRTALLRAVSPWAASGLQAWLGEVGYALAGAENRQRFLRPLARWKAVLDADWDLDRTAHAMAGCELRWLTRDLVLDGISTSRFDRLVRVRGREHLDAAREAGQGVILLLSHYGSHMLPAHWAVRAGLPFRVYMERPHTISKLLARHFDQGGERGQADLFISRREAGAAESARSILRAVQILKAGMILGIAGDVRWTGAHTASAQFLGSEQSFTSTWVALAGMTGAPAVPTFAHMDSDGGFTLEFEPPMTVRRGSDPTLHVQGFLRCVEARLKSDPAGAVEYISWPELVEGPTPGRLISAA
jgi:KDO2-lipid IV(A) lauroyltransferase